MNIDFCILLSVMGFSSSFDGLVWMFELPCMHLICEEKPWERDFSFAYLFPVYYSI
ncbi:hypothetical protein JHK82_016496 [Glycine max]|nr:hypothetical protein JHK87_016442 [Glycine soja]KAG5032926.1 hypothetical protein JHK85_016908 [Glycine max]KAG5047143.1 hypothetical protein JHK86_016549 [Glycine max]KAG5149615.1 hypothetical protein JHK82_016496 [Glycine max]